MSFIRTKEIPKNSGTFYKYEVETYRIDGKPRQRYLKYLGASEPITRVKALPSSASVERIEKRKIYTKAHDLAINIRRDEAIGLDRIHNRLLGIFEYPIARTTVNNWIKPINVKVNRKRLDRIVHNVEPWEQHIAVIQNNTGIDAIDRLTAAVMDRDFRSDIRQQAALYYLEDFKAGYSLDEIEAKSLIKKAIAFIQKTQYSSKYNTVDLHKALGNDGDDRFTLLSILPDKSIYGMNPLDLLCVEESNLREWKVGPLE